MFSEKQMKIMAFPYTGYDALICDGAVRSGKTSVMSLSFFRWAMLTFTGQAFAFCGKSVGAVERNIVTPLLAVKWVRTRFSVKYNRGDHVLIARDGNRENRFYLFGGKDESSYTLIQGITLAGVLLDEVALMPRSFVEQALARCSVSGAKMWFNCNPENPLHWFRQEWILKAQEHNALHLHFLMNDNPGLSEKTLQRYQDMFSGVFYDRYVRGLWVLAEGLIYPMFTDSSIVDAVPDRGEYYISCDYGTLNPFSAGLWCWDGKIATRIREYYYSGRDERSNKTDEEYYTELEKLAGDLHVKSVIVDPSAASFIEVIRRHKRFTVKKAVNDVLPGIMTTARYLQDGTIKIHLSCEDAIREFGLYRWDEESTEDRPIKENDHAMDDIRYFVMTILRHKVGKEQYIPLYARR